MVGGSPSPFDESIQPTGEDGNVEESDSFSIVDGTPTFDRRLTRRQKLQRGGLCVLVVSVAAFLSLGGPSWTSSWLGSLRASLSRPASTISTPVTLGNVGTTQVAVPPGTNNNLTLKLEPSNGPDDYIYSCWISERAETQGLSYHLHVGMYTEASGNWTMLAAPVSTAATCAVVTDRERESGVLLAAWPAIASTSNVCVLPQLFHSDDAGKVWQAIPWPREVEPSCDPEFFLEAGRLYVQSTTALLPQSELSPILASGFLLTTDTDTISWRPADAGQAIDTWFQLIALRPHGRLLAESLQGGGKSYQAGQLWESVDSGQHWHIMALLPGDAPIVSVSSNPEATDHGGWGYVYVTYFAGGTEPKPAIRYGVLDTQEAGWVSLPVPESGATPQGSPMVSYLSEGGEGPRESLIYLLPGGSSSRTQSPLYLPWLWDPATKAWISDPVNLPANSIPQGVSWQNGDMSILVSVISQGLLPALATVSLTFSPRQLPTSR